MGPLERQVYLQRPEVAIGTDFTGLLIRVVLSACPPGCAERFTEPGPLNLAFCPGFRGTCIRQTQAHKPAAEGKSHTLSGVSIRRKDPRPQLGNEHALNANAGKRREGQELIFKATMTKNFPKLKSDTNQRSRKLREHQLE